MPQRWLSLLILFLVRLVMGYQFQAIASVSSHLVSEFGFSYAQVGTLIGFFLLPGVLVAIPSGLMTRAVTDKNLLMLGVAFMIAGSLTMAVAVEPAQLFGGRLMTGVGGAVLNVILTKMVTDWFFETEIVTALSVMLTAWPAGIALGLLTQGLIADQFGWSLAIHATAVSGAFGLMLTWLCYTDAPRLETIRPAPLRFGLPLRQLVHTSVIGIAWALYNTAIIILVSFGPDVLIGSGYTPGAARSTTSLMIWVALVSLPFGGRAIEAFRHVTAPIAVTFMLAASAMFAISQSYAPELSFIAVGVFAGIPGGALMSLSSEAFSKENRGPGFGVFYTWFYLGMAIGPVLAGWSRDVSGSTATPIVLAGTMAVSVVLILGVFRILQVTWKVESADSSAQK